VKSYRLLYRCGRPSTAVSEETDEKVNKLVTNDRRLSVDFIAESVGIFISWRSIFDFDRKFADEKSLYRMAAAHVIIRSEGGPDRRSSQSVNLLGRTNNLA